MGVYEDLAAAYGKIVNNPAWTSDPPLVSAPVVARHREVMGDPLTYPATRWWAPRYAGRVVARDGWLDRQQVTHPVDRYDGIAVDLAATMASLHIFRTGRYVVHEREDGGYDLAEVVEVAR